VAQARRQLGPRYVHFRWSQTGICDHLLDAYEARLAEGDIGFETWIAAEYDPAGLEASFAAKRARLIPWIGRN
jgi:hypothetical protein